VSSLDTHPRQIIARTVENDLEHISEAATAAIWREVPAYGAATDPNLKQQVTVHCQAVFSTFAACLREGRLPTRMDFPVTGTSALYRVGQGISLADFLRAFRVGQLTMWDSLVTATRDVPQAKDAALAAVSVLMQVIELGSSVAAEAYMEAQQYRLADRDRLARDLLEDLLAGREPALEPKLGMVRTAGLVPEAGVLVVSARPVRPDSMNDETTQAIAAVLRRVKGRQVRGLVVLRHGEIVGVFPASDTPSAVVANLEGARSELRGRGVELVAGASTVHPRLVDVPNAYREACLARGALGNRPGVLALSSLSAFNYLMLSDDQTARRLIDPRVRRFIEEDLASGGTSIETINAYVASDLNAKVAAEMLHLHVNTTYYRLERIAERTGLDLRKLTEVIDLLVAVRILARRTTPGPAA
jgi:PucR-like helix-turn-helix protein/diguanylate cyclase with GGDEF domain